MADPLPLSLQPFPRTNGEKQSLQYLISRINDQRGSFRNVTEQSLEEEIRGLEKNEVLESQDDVTESVEDVESAKTHKEELSSKRDEILSQIARAHNEVAQALDFVSLLLSKHVDAAAQTTISPYIKQTLPLKCLDGEIVKTRSVLETEKYSQEIVSMGWRTQSLGRAADFFLDSALRLEEEMGKETTYWNHLLAVKDKGWSLSRLPKEKHTLGVCFGFAEAYSDFRNRGLAALRRGVDGNISLDRNANQEENYTLRVRVLQQGRVLASSPNNTNRGDEDQSIERRILDIRNSLYDEELYREIHREARNLLNHGIRCVNSRVFLPYETDKQIEIDLIPLAELEEHESTESQVVAETVVTSLRVLLSRAHRQNLDRRSQTPVPLREQKAPRPTYRLLKPIVEWLQHLSSNQKITELMRQLNEVLPAAGVKFSFDLTKSARDSAVLPPIPNEDTSPTSIDPLLHSMTLPLHSTMTVQILNDDSQMEIQTHTALQQYGTSYNLSVNQKLSSLLPKDLPSSLSFTDFIALQNQILHVITLAILQYLVLSSTSRGPPWRTISLHCNSIMRNRLDGRRGRYTATINIQKSSLNFSIERDGMKVTEATWNATNKDVECRKEGKTILEIFHQT